MKKGLFNRRIPTTIALLVLVAIIGVSTFLIQQGIFYVGKAAPDTQPQNLMLTNVTDTSFTVVFTTNGLTDVVLNINDTKTGSSLILDDRDKKTGAQNKYFSHHISVPNLTPDKTYVFKLIISGKEYIDPLYSVKTGQPISSQPPTQNPIFGKVLLPDGTAASDSVVIVKTDQSENISAVTDNNGEFILPTNSLRNKESTNYVTLQTDSMLTIAVFRQTMSATVKSTFAVAQNLPPITLLQQYMFTQSSETSSTQSSQLNISLPKSSGKTLSIIVPKPGETFTDLRPIFKGTSIPNSTVNISIKNVINKQFLSNSDGSWSLRPDAEFAPGKYNIVATSSDINGNPTTESSNFAIFPQGSQIAADQLLPTTSPTPTKAPKPTATSTPNPTPTAIPTATPTTTTNSPTPTINNPSPTSLTPTITITDTPTPKIEPTATPTLRPTLFFTPTKLPPIAKPGATQETIALTSFSVILIIAGITLLIAL